jgi:hypothetical protein
LCTERGRCAATDGLRGTAGTIRPTVLITGQRRATLHCREVKRL